jgi:hypothetical protein
MSDASDFLKKWVSKNITPTTAQIRDDTLTAGRFVEECLWGAGTKPERGRRQGRGWRQSSDLYDLRVEPRCRSKD